VSEDKILIKGLTFGGVDYGDVVSYKEYEALQQQVKELTEANEKLKDTLKIDELHPVNWIGAPYCRVDI